MYKTNAGVWGTRGSNFASCTGPPAASVISDHLVPSSGDSGEAATLPRMQQPPDTHREFFHISFQNSFQVELFQFPLQSWRQPGIHGGPSRQHNVLVEFRPGPKKKVFVLLYSVLCTTVGTCTDRGVNTNLRSSHYTKTDCTSSGDLLRLSQKAEIKKYCAFKILSLLILTEIVSRQPVKLQKLSLSPTPSIQPP